MPPAVLASIALGSTAASLYGTKKAAEQNRRALEAQERDSERAVSEGGKDRELSVQDMANQQARWDRAMAADEKRWQDYLEVQRPHWNIGAGALGRLTELAGLPGGGSAAMPSGGPPGPGQPFDPNDDWRARIDDTRWWPVGPDGIKRQPTPEERAEHDGRRPFGQAQAPGSTTQPAPRGTPIQAAGLVWMRAPTGQTRQVPAAMVERYRQRGAEVMA